MAVQAESRATKRDETMNTGTDCAVEWRPTWRQRVLGRLSSIKYWFRNCLTQKALNLVVWLNHDSNYIKHTQREVPDWFGEEGPNRWIADGTVELLAVLSHQGHSGGSIGFAVNFFKTMARFEPWGPLTGADSEWRELDYGDEPSWQNIRASHVFKDADGRAYDIQGKVFREPDGCCFTNSDSRVYIEFPYTPKTEYVDVPKSEE